MREKDIYEAMNQGVLLCDEKSRILYFNSSNSRFIGYRLEEICGKPIRDIRPGAVVPEVIANGKPQESLFRVENDQEYFADIYPVMEDGQVVGSVSVVTSMMNANCIKDKVLKLEEQEKVMKDRLSSSPKTLETIAKAKKWPDTLLIFCFRVKVDVVRNYLLNLFTMKVIAGMRHLWPSTVRRLIRRCLRVNCLAMKMVHLPEPEKAASPDFLKQQKAGRFFLMKYQKWIMISRQSCCVCCRKRNSGESADYRKLTQTSD